MSTGLRVLMVEDSEDDALLIEHTLRSGGLAVQWLRVETEEGLRAALREQQWDIVLSDFYLPSFNAKGTLQTLRDTGFDIPVIVISGTVGEDVAVETLRLGADDYLLKQKLTRLVPAVTRAIAVAGDRRRQRKLERMQTIILQNSPDLICSLDGRGCFLEVSAASHTILGYAPAELEGTHLAALVHPDDLPALRRILQPAAQDQPVQDIECRLLHRSGRPVFVTWSTASSAADEVIVAVGRDITERRQKDETLRHVEEKVRHERALLRSLIDSIPDLVFFKDQKFVFQGCNRAFETYLGMPEHDLVGKTDFDILPEKWARYYRGEDEALFASRQSQRIEEQIPAADGSIGIFDTIKAPFYGPDGTLLGLVGVSRNITDRKQMEEALRENEQHLRQERDYLDAVIDSLPGVFYHFDQNMRLLRWNRRSEQVSGYGPQELLGFPASEFFSPEDRQRVAARIRDVMQFGQSQIEADYVARDGRRVPHLFTGMRFDHHGEAHLIGVGVDISERRHAEQQLHHLATHDDLTGLPNRNLILSRIEDAVALARTTGRPLALLYLDLDRFKVINDGYGHPFGDEVLKAAGKRLVALVREGDIVARHGGDEFLILMNNLRAADDAYEVARKIVASLDQPLTVQDRLIHLSGSIGVSVFPDDGSSADELIGNADIAMYRAKSLGRNNFHFFTPELSKETQLRIELETRLRGAAAGGQLHVVYQPKVALESGVITGCEALLRWQHPELGAVSPDLFIPIAEESGLIVPIGDWVLRTACQQARVWLDAGLPPIRMAVNVSARQFLQQDVTAWVLRTLQQADLPAGSLELELTESLIAQDAMKAIATVSELRQAGVKLAIDDFGTGYSSLNYLKRFHVDTLKIDQSFVRNILHSTEDATIVLTVISLAHSLDFKVIAEGVETAEQRDFLRLNGCDEIQGYYFSPPVTAAQFELLLRNGLRHQDGDAEIPVGA